jgi:hypothetical protein
MQKNRLKRAGKNNIERRFYMGWQLTRDEAKIIVADALLSVADFDSSDPSIENFSFARFHDFHTKVFLSKLKMLLLDKKDKGNCYNVALNEGMIKEWKTLADCINYVHTKQERVEIENKL